MNNNPGMLVVFLVMAFIFLIAIFIPFSLIWSLNTLFSFSIDFSWKTWLAAAIMIVVFGPKPSSSSSSSSSSGSK